MPEPVDPALLTRLVAFIKQGFSMLPVYNSTDEQLHNRDYCNGRKGYRIITGTQWLPSWSYRRYYNSSTIDAIYLINAISGTETDITTDIADGQVVLQSLPIENYELVFYIGSAPIGYEMTEGYYYLKIVDFTGTRYTELFQVKSDLDVGLIKNFYSRYKVHHLQEDPLLMANMDGVYNNENYTVILYGLADVVGFGWLAFESEMGTPEYTKEEKGQTNKDGVFIYDFQKAGKKYNLTELVPEHIADALSAYFLADYILIIPKRGPGIAVKEIDFKISWQDDGCDAMVDINFISDYITKRRCSEEIDERYTRYM